MFHLKHSDFFVDSTQGYAVYLCVENAKKMNHWQDTLHMGVIYFRNSG